MAAYGPIGAAIAVDNAFANNPSGTVFQGTGYTGINHDIILIGWDDSKGAWLLRNSWGPTWCDAGYCWIKYGANQVGTEAVWCTAAPLPPQPPPTPVPPGPGPVPAPGSVTTFTLNNPLAAGNYEVSTLGTAAGIASVNKAVQDLQALQGKQWGLEPPLLPPQGAPSNADKRIEALENSMIRLADSILTLQKLIEGKVK
jgi:hypothetical protein